MKNSIPNKEIEEINKLSEKTEWDIFPLDKMLPISSVLKIFRDEYNKVVVGNGKFSSRRYQRLREGYFGLFVAVAKSKMENKEHLIVFPKETNRDLELLSYNKEGRFRTKMWSFQCDVKEYTKHSPSIQQFITGSVLPRLKNENYHIIIGHEGGSFTVQEVIDSLSQNNYKHSVWIVGSIDDSYLKGTVTYIHGDIVMNFEVDLRVDVPQIQDGDATLIFQDTLRHTRE